MQTYKASRFEISYAAWGKPQARAYLFFHGFPGSCLQASALASLTLKHGAFLVACDRPGYGRTVGPGSNFDYLDANFELLTSLGVEDFHVVGVSGGAPWAHMMASRFSEKTRSLRVVCGLATYNRQTAPYFSRFQINGMRLRTYLPTFLVEAILNKILRKFDPQKTLDRFLKFLNQADQAILLDPGNRALIEASMSNSRLQGARGVARDADLFRSDWLKRACDRRRLAAVPIFYAHGKQDQILNWRMSEWMRAQIPSAKLTLFEREGHYSLAFRQAEAILAEA